MDITDVLDTIKADSLKTLKEEFLDLLESAKKDKSDFIKKSAEQVKQALIYRAKGQLSTDDVETLLNKQKKIAQIEANNSKIQTLSRIQKVTYKILDISLDVLVKAIVPIK